MKPAGVIMCVFGVLLVFVGMQGNVAADAQRPPEKPCSGPEYRQFDFWLGNWEVRDKKGVLEGTNRVTLENNCVVQEEWKSSDSDQTGKSLSMYDYRTKKWFQSWYDSWGNMLTISGNPRKGSMVMRGERLTPQGKIALERTVWTPLADQRVHQVWDYSMDGGETWTQRFEGFYKKAN